ncbi:hypothetical protein TrLO_g14884 [Triparma laevis f. longispina]|uniref:Mediator of RNA polymerase II transcription subunit 7 n=1 Tax=Triparma laevis f. longispina TaxID=1714387 RepID=A0A9W7L127_9STRA|nr:hypothetical protein TrLO_g14884 [Triparma laevis f. longispina]
MASSEPTNDVVDDNKPPEILVGEFPPPPPHAALFGDHLLEKLRSEKSSFERTFAAACESIAPPPLPPRAPLGIFGRIVDHTTLNVPLVTLNRDVSAKAKLAEVKSKVEEALNIFTKLSPDSCDLDLNKAKVAEMKQKFVEMHGVCSDLRKLQGVTRVRDRLRSLKEEEEEELENLRAVVKRAKVALGDEQAFV